MERPSSSSDGLIPPSNSPVSYGGVSTNTSSGSHGEEEKPADGEADVTVLPHEASPTKVYLKRFYVLLMFCLLCFTQGLTWNTWGPLTKSAEPVFNWDDATIALLVNWGPISYVVSTLFFTWLMDVKGLRWSCVTTAVIVAAGCGFRCITSSVPTVTWLMHLGQFFIGLGGPLTMGGPPLVSAVWFPVHERTTATAVGVFMGTTGVAISFIIGPLLVPQPSYLPCDKIYNHSKCEVIYHHNYTNQSIITNMSYMRNRIMDLMYIEFGFSMLVLVTMVLYLPARPPLPPSITAAQKRVKQGLKDLLRHPKFWIIGIPYALSTGVYACWSSVLGLNLKPFKHIDETTAGLIGFYGTIAGAAASVAIARFADIFAKRMKLFLIVLFSGATLMFVWFAIICQQIIPMSTKIITVNLYLSMIIGSICLYGGIPLFFELVCENCYPIAEGVTNGFLTLLNNIAGLIFLLILMLNKYIGTSWMNWFLVGSIVLCMPILVSFKEKYQRFDIDTTTEEETEKLLN